MDNTLERLERIPLGRPHRKLLFQGGLGYLFDAMDGAVVGLLIIVLGPIWALSDGQKGVLVSASLGGFAVGALIAGYLGDRFGRKNVMMYALLFFAVFSVAAAFSTGWDMFFWCRLLAGVGLGAESAIVAPFISEFIPSKHRGRYIGYLSIFFALGFVAAALLCKVLLPIIDVEALKPFTGMDAADSLFGLAGWQLIQIVTAMPVLILLVWRRVLPESPRYLLGQGRVAEANAVVSRIEADYEQSTGTKLPPVAPSAETASVEETAGQKQSFFSGLAVLVSTPEMMKRTFTTCALWLIVTFAFYGFTAWIPSLLAMNKAATLDAVLNTIVLFYLAQIPGYASASLLNDRFDRKWTAAFYLGLAVISSLAMAGANDSVVTGTIAGMVLSFCLTGVYASLYTLTPEIYPTRVRATGMSVSTAVGRVGGIISPSIIPLFVVTSAAGVTTYGKVFVMLAAVLAVGAVIVAVAGISTSGQTLEDLNEARHEKTPA